MSKPSFFNPFAQGAEKTGETRTQHGSLTEGQAGPSRCPPPACHRECGQPYEDLLQDELAAAMLLPPTARPTLRNLGPGPSTPRAAGPVAQGIASRVSVGKSSKQPDSIATKRSRKGSIAPLKAGLHIPSTIHLCFKKVADFLKPPPSVGEIRRQDLRELLAQNPLPAAAAKLPAGPPPRPPRPPSLAPEVLDFMEKYSFPPALVPRAAAPKKVKVVSPLHPQVSMRPENKSALGFSQAAPAPPPKSGRVGGSLPTIPLVRQKIGVAASPRGHAPQAVATHWEVLQLNRIRVPKLSEARWVTGGVLGQGGFATVLCVYDVARGEACAMKVVHYARGMAESSCRGMINELKVLRRLSEEARSSPFLLQPYIAGDLWAWRSREYLHILTELCTGRDLSYYKYRLSEFSLSIVCAEVILGLNHLHRLDIVHHDLKPQNILVNADGHCVIGDYGAAQFLDARRLVTRRKGSTGVMTIPFAAPEILSDDYALHPTYGPAVDYWSLGATLVSLIMDDDFLPGASDMSSLAIRLTRIERKIRQRGGSEEFNGFVMALLEENPARRPTYPAIARLPFLDSVDFEDIQAQRCAPFASVHESGMLAHGYTLPEPPAREARAPVNLIRRLRQEQLSLVVDESYDVEAHIAALTAAI